MLLERWEWSGLRTWKGGGGGGGEFLFFLSSWLGETSLIYFQ